MLGTTFFGDWDLAAVALALFVLFFFGLIYYLQTENMREGYPLVDDDGRVAPNQGPFPVPAPKTYVLPHGRSVAVMPSAENEAEHLRDGLALARSSAAAGSPYIPTGNPMVDGVGPASWAPRRDMPELDGHGHIKIRPMAGLEGFSILAGRDPRGKAVVAGDGEVVGRITDMWIDVPENMVRYLVVDLNPEGTGQTRLIPINMCRIKSDRVVVRSLYPDNFAGIPTTRQADAVTLLEEEKIMAWYAGGTLYATPTRIGPVI